MQLIADETYALRKEDGTYAKIMKQLEALDTAALANATYNEHFTQSTSSKSDNYYSYVDNADGSEFSTILFGEICHSSAGTRLSAMGNHWAGPNNMPIKDNTSVKGMLMLCHSTMAPSQLGVFYDNQIATLGEIRAADEEEEEASGYIPSLVKECIQPIPNNESGHMELIAVNLPKKYAIPPTSHKKNTLSSVKPERMTKKRLSPEWDVETLDSDSVNNEEDKSASAMDRGYKIALGEFYPLNILPDHQGPLFQQQKARLVQLNIRNLDGSLIAPWRLYEKLRPGTVVLIQAGLVCWIMKDNDHSPEKKFYQLVGHSIKILAESGEAVEEHNPPIIVQKAAVKGIARPSPTKPTSKAFASFESPTKKTWKM